MVICVGVPYAKLSDIKIYLKREFLDKRNKIEKNGLTGQEWYTEDALNAVNQSLGRVIRHINDYGIMICFGIEFSYNIRYLSKWIRRNVNIIQRLNENDKFYYKGLTEFLNNTRDFIGKKTNKLSIINNKDNVNDFIEEIEYGFTEENNDDDNSLESWEEMDEDNTYEGRDNLGFIENFTKNNYSYLGYKRYK